MLEPARDYLRSYSVYPLQDNVHLALNDSMIGACPIKIGDYVNSLSSQDLCAYPFRGSRGMVNLSPWYLTEYNRVHTQ